MFKKIAVDRFDVAPIREKSSVLANTFVVGGLTVAAKLAGAAKTVVSARYFGPGNDLDAYLLAFLVPSFFADVLSGALNPALVPVLIEAFETGGRDGVWSVYADALYRSSAALLAVGIMLVACAFTIDPAIVGVHLANLGLARRMLLIMAPILPLSAVANVWRSILNAEMRFSAAAFSPALTPLTAVVFLYLANRWGILVLAWGSTVRYAGGSNRSCFRAATRPDADPAAVDAGPRHNALRRKAVRGSRSQ